MHTSSCQKNHTSSWGTKIFKHRKYFRLGLLPLWYEHNLLEYLVIEIYYKFFGGKQKKRTPHLPQHFQSYCVVITVKKSEEHVLEVMLISFGKQFQAENFLFSFYVQTLWFMSPQIFIFIFRYLNLYSHASLKISLNFIYYTITKRCPFKHL